MERLSFANVGRTHTGTGVQSARRPPRRKKKEMSIVSRLTDTSKYTGAHKHRFDKTGKGRGLRGRDMGNSGLVSDLSAITRTNLRISQRKLDNPRMKTRKAAVPSYPMSARRPARKTTDSSRSVLDRLTDASGYTGAHKARFDKKGKGLGLRGRDMGNECKITDLSQITRSNLRGKKASVSQQSKAYKRTGLNNKPIQKFGTQAKTIRKIWVYQNGDKHHQPVSIAINKGVSNFDKLLQAITERLTLGTGSCRKIYKIDPVKNSFQKVTHLDRIADGDYFLACGPEKIKKDALPASIF